MFFVYIIEAVEIKRYYIGQTENLQNRIDKHNEGRNLSTKAYVPWQLKWWKGFDTRSEAIRIERLLKGIKKRVLLEKYVKEHRFSGCGPAERDKLRWLAHPDHGSGGSTNKSAG